MNDATSRDDGSAPRRDESNFDFGPLDSLLRDWHDENAVQAKAGRDQLLAALSSNQSRDRANALDPAETHTSSSRADTARGVLFRFRRIVMHPSTRAAACLALLATLFAFFLPYGPTTKASAQDAIVQAPDGGRLDAVDREGNLVGPCPLKHTDVDVAISGHFSRITLKQTYTNPYPQKIEALYTFPLSHRSAVDRMNMVVGDRVIIGEVKERGAARAIYEQARESGYVASLLEQERPNIFTQSIANIEPGATVVVEIAYIEMLESRDGLFRFDFPMVVGPRYIPGYSHPLPADLPAPFVARRGIVLLGPASVLPEKVSDTVSGEKVSDTFSLDGAIPIEPPPAAWWNDARSGKISIANRFTARYVDGASERGETYSDRCGQLNGRWFLMPAPRGPRGGDGVGFEKNTNLVPDASRITPMPVRPPLRAGHDISMNVTIDSGGPAIVDLKSELHQIRPVETGNRSQTRFSLATANEIPNRDFVLSWRTDAPGISEGVFTAATEKQGGFVTVVVNPPPRLDESLIRPRELVFVLDTSGSMSGFPIEKAKEVMSKAIAAMRASDTFNMITFSGDTHVLWSEPKPATPENVAAAQQFLATRQGGGGTEMMKAIEAALKQTRGAAATIDAMALANLPADGRSAVVVAPYSAIGSSGERHMLKVSDALSLSLRLSMALPTIINPEGVKLRLTGQWITENGERIFVAREVGFASDDFGPMRICMFLTDGYVGNDQGIVQAVRDNAGTTRVFSFGIGNSVNRYLLEQMARAGRGECEFVTLAEQADASVARFTQRIQNPVLTDIALRFDGIEVTDVVSGAPSDAPTLLPDLYDVKPLVFHGRYTKAGTGSVVITGRSGAGRYERSMPLTLTEIKPTRLAIGTASEPARPGPGERPTIILPGISQPAPGVDLWLSSPLPALWARSKVAQTLAPHLSDVEQGTLAADVRNQVIALGESFTIMTPFTSFVAVEKARMTLGGKPVLVAVPIELPQGLRWEGFFGEATPWARPQMLRAQLAQATQEAAPAGDAIAALRMQALQSPNEEARKTVVQGLDALSDSSETIALRESMKTNLYFNVNNRMHQQATAIDPNFQLADFFGVEGVPSDAVVFDNPVPTNTGTGGDGTRDKSTTDAKAAEAPPPGHRVDPGPPPPPSQIPASTAPTGGAPGAAAARAPAAPAAKPGAASAPTLGEPLSAGLSVTRPSGEVTFPWQSERGSQAEVSAVLRARVTNPSAGYGLVDGLEKNAPDASPGDRFGTGYLFGESTDGRLGRSVTGSTRGFAGSGRRLSRGEEKGFGGGAGPGGGGGGGSAGQTAGEGRRTAGKEVQQLRKSGRVSLGASLERVAAARELQDSSEVFAFTADLPWETSDGDQLSLPTLGDIPGLSSLFTRPAPQSDAMIAHVVTDFVQPSVWFATDESQPLAKLAVDANSVRFESLNESPEALRVVADATSLQKALTESLKAIAAIEPIKPADDNGDASANVRPVEQGAAPNFLMLPPRQEENPHVVQVPMPAAPGGRGDAAVTDAAPSRADGEPVAAAAPQVRSAQGPLVIYDVRDLLSIRGDDGSTSVDPMMALELIGAIQTFIDREGWVHAGGERNQVRVLAETLVVQGPNATHTALAEFLQMLRTVSAAPEADMPAFAKIDRTDRTIAAYDATEILIADGTPEAAARLALVLELLDASAWERNGGAGRVRTVGGLLLIENSLDIVKRSMLLLDQLAFACGVELPKERRDAAEAAQRLAAPKTSDAAVIVHPVDDLLLALHQQTGAGLDSLVLGLTKFLEASANASSDSVAKPNPTGVLVGPGFVVKETPATQLRIDALLQGARQSYGIAPAPLPRSDEARAWERERLLNPPDDDARIDRFNELFRRLEPRLFAMVIASEDPDAKLVDRAKFNEVLAGATLPKDGAPLRVNVLVEKVSSAESALAASGLRVDDRNATLRLVVGTVEPSRLAAVALVEGVRRIEWMP